MWCYRKFLALSLTKCEEEPHPVTPIGVTVLGISSHRWKFFATNHHCPATAREHRRSLCRLCSRRYDVLSKPEAIESYPAHQPAKPLHRQDPCASLKP